jgi:MOSC domain-containing protein YiiM
MASVVAVCISENKGTEKTSVPEVFLKKDHGVEGDAHSGGGIRQISVLAVESVDKLRDRIPDLYAGIFAENILTSGVCLYALPVGTQMQIGDAVIEITQIGKKCHNDGCEIKQKAGDCVMPREGVFAAVLKDGLVKPGDNIAVGGK